MATDGDAFEQWLDEARIPGARRTVERLAVLRAAFAFLECSGRDYCSVRILAHFLFHCQLGLKVSQVARLVGVARMTASRQNQLSSREVVRSIQHRLSGRPYGKLLPRYAGPIAEFLVTHPGATRADVLDFIEGTWQIRVSTVALHNFLKKYGLDQASRLAATAKQSEDPTTNEPALLQALSEPPAPGHPVPVPSEDFFLAAPTMPAPSCCCPKCSPGGISRRSASRTSTARCSEVS
jgi:hypothetical protein